MTDKKKISDAFKLYASMNNIVYSLHNMDAHSIWESRVEVYRDSDDIEEWVSDPKHLQRMIDTFGYIMEIYYDKIDIDSKMYHINK